ncbi:MAG TPA: hypothetical protein VMR52_08720 [Dehalococcoidia bacterium]|nr:hypothetical protein [Dehalococcoidia bacterium]
MTQRSIADTMCETARRSHEVIRQEEGLVLYATARTRVRAVERGDTKDQDFRPTRLVARATTFFRDIGRAGS